jgi:hypothetical protein
MSTRKSVLAIISARIKKFPVFILFPLRCLSEVIEGAEDILCLFGKKNKKAYAAVNAAGSALLLLRDYGPLDFVDVDVENPEGRVKVKILMR